MNKLKGFQKKYLRGLAHSLKPVVIIGQNGLTEPVMASIDEALETHELIKIKFNEFKEKEIKNQLTEKIIDDAGCELAGQIGHIIIVYRQMKNPKKRIISIPSK